MNEAETGTEHIDSALKAAGWGLVEGSRSEFPDRSTGGIFITQSASIFAG